MLTTWKILQKPFPTFREWQSRYGDTFLVKAFNGDVVVTSRPENIKRVFAARSEAVSVFAIDAAKPLLGDSSLILAQGPKHRAQRKMVMPSFHGDLIADQAEIIHDVALNASRNWHAEQPLRIMDFTLDVSLEVIIRIVFGVTDSSRVEDCKSRIIKSVGAFKPWLAFSKLTQRSFFGLSAWDRFVRERDKFNGFLQSEIESRRNSGRRGDDLLSRLLEVSHEDGTPLANVEISHQLATMLFAGHETTQISMAWAMSWLARNPQITDRLESEFEESDLIAVAKKSSLLDGICRESLRLNPIVPDLVRAMKEPVEFEDRMLPANTNIALPACLVHYDSNIYSNPERFDPDRWNGKSFKPYECFPFGGGVRRCVGATLAMLEMKVVIATWINGFRFRLPPNAPASEPVVRRNLTMAPKSGIPPNM